MERNNRRWAERVDADWARIMSEFIINGCYSRNILPTDVRELCAVAALTVLNRTDESIPSSLTGHDMARRYYGVIYEVLKREDQDSAKQKGLAAEVALQVEKILAGLGFGLLPAWRATRADLRSTMGGSSRQGTSIGTPAFRANLSMSS